MSDNPGINMEDVLNENQDVGQEQDAYNFTTPTSQQSVQSLAQRLQQSRSKLKELRQKVRHALDNDYAGYMLDTDKNGQQTFGSKSYARLEADKMMIGELSDEVRMLENQLQQEQQVTQTSQETASDIAQRVWRDGVKYVDKNLHDQVRSYYGKELAKINWADANLRTDVAKETLMRMLFNHAAQTAKVERDRTRQQQRQTGNKEFIEGDASDDAGQEPKTNEFGHEEGSLAHQISEQYKARRQGNRGTLADRGKNKDS